MEWKNSPLDHGNKKREFVSHRAHMSKDTPKNLHLSGLFDDPHMSLPPSSLFDDDADHDVITCVENDDADLVVDEIETIDTFDMGISYNAPNLTSSHDNTVQFDIQVFVDHLHQIEQEFPPLSAHVTLASTFLSTDHMLAHIYKKVSVSAQLKFCQYILTLRYYSTINLWKKEYFRRVLGH